MSELSLKASLQAVLDTYDGDVREVEKKRRPMDGVLGFGRAPADDPCHGRMDKAVEELFAAAGDASAEEAADALELLLGAAGAYEGPEYAKLSLVAAQRHALETAARLRAEDATRLLDAYMKAYPRKRQFPIQKKIVQALEKAARG